MPRLVPGPSFFRLVEYEALPPRPVGVIDRVLAGELDGVLVRDVLSHDRVDQMVEQLEQRASALPHFPISDDSRSFSLGPMLVTCSQGLHDYLAQTAQTDQLLDELLGQPEGFRHAAGEWLSRLVKSMPVAFPRSPDDRPFGVASVRCLPPDNELAAHSETEQLQQPAYASFRSQLADHNLLSYLVALNDTEPSDALVVYKLRVDAPLPNMSVDTKRKLRGRVEQYERFGLPVRKGDLLVFHGSRHYHRVLATQGQVSRWTVGGFMAKSADGRLLVWS